MRWYVSPGGIGRARAITRHAIVHNTIRAFGHLPDCPPASWKGNFRVTVVNSLRSTQARAVRLPEDPAKERRWRFYPITTTTKCDHGDSRLVSSNLISPSSKSSRSNDGPTDSLSTNSTTHGLIAEGNLAACVQHRGEARGGSHVSLFERFRAQPLSKAQTPHPWPPFLPPPPLLLSVSLSACFSRVSRRRPQPHHRRVRVERERDDHSRGSSSSGSLLTLAAASPRPFPALLPAPPSKSPPPPTLRR